MSTLLSHKSTDQEVTASSPVMPDSVQFPRRVSHTLRHPSNNIIVHWTWIQQMFFIQFFLVQP